MFGWLSDKIGRKKIIMAGCLIAALTYFPIFKALTHYANPALEEARANAPGRGDADPATCSFQFDPVGKKVFTNSCDIAKAALAKAGVPYKHRGGPGRFASPRSPSAIPKWPAYEGAGPEQGRRQGQGRCIRRGAQGGADDAAGYPDKADPARINKPMVLLLLTILVIYVTMVYGPIAAWLVELFPTRIRYTSMSLPYHIGNGWFGGFLPTIAFALVAATGNIYYGLWYPIVIALMTFVIGSLFLRETKDVDIRN